MKKITISIALLTTMLTTKAQDTICTMVKTDEVIEFEYKTSTIINRENYKGVVFIKVKRGEVLCLHLYDKIKRKRKVIVTYPNGEKFVDKLDSKDNVYFSKVGPLTVDIK